MIDTTIPVEITDPVNAAILAVSEDRVAGFQRDPFAEIARLSSIDVATVHERLRAMLAAGTIRRIRQTLMATNLAPGALVAWRISNDRLDAAFDFLWKQDPFSGHIVIRSTDAETPGSAYRLWTTLKVPQGFSMKKHCDFLAARIGAEGYRVMPAKRLFALGVGHVRRRGMEPGSKTEELGQVIDTNVVELSDLEWRVLEALWARSGAASVRDLQPAFPEIAYTTLMTTLDRLHRKNVLVRTKQGRAFFYQPKLSRPEFDSARAADALRIALSADGSQLTPLLSFFVQAVGDKDDDLLDELEGLVRARRAEIDTKRP